MSAPVRSIAVAFTRSAKVVTWRAPLSNEQVQLLERCLANLLDLGHVAAFDIGADHQAGWTELIKELRSRCGELAVEACLSATVCREQVRPAFLMPVWAFDHEIDGAPASTAQFLGLDLEMIATPSPYEELGVHLPGHAGRWQIHARPMF
jgi:hypothetical protein